MTQQQAGRKRANFWRGRPFTPAASYIRRVAAVLVLLMSAVLMPAAPASALPQVSADSTRATTTTTFSYTGSNQTFTVPAGITELVVEAFGGQGGPGSRGGNPGKGGYTKGSFAVTPGEQMTIQVGGQGATGDIGVSDKPGGWPNGGAALAPSAGGTHIGGGGGGSSNVTREGTSLLIAGGGGGSSGGSATINSSQVIAGGGGGGGGGYYGGGGGRAAGCCTGGSGGTQVSGGARGSSTDNGDGATDGAFSHGGKGGWTGQAGTLVKTGKAGGHGGGDFGGTGDGPSAYSGSGGGGGSSFINAAAGVTPLENTQGVQIGNGLVAVTYWAPEPPSSVELVSPSSGAIMTAADLQRFTVRADDPNGDPYRGKITVENLDNGATMQLETPLTPSGQQAMASPASRMVTGSYRWRAYPCDSPPSPYPAGCGANNGAWVYFGVGDPPVPAQVTPAEAQTLSTVGTQAFTMRAVDVESHPYSGTIEIRTASNALERTLTTPSTASGSEASVTLSPNLAAGSYKWRVKACKTDVPGVCSAYTGYRTFTVSGTNTPPGTPSASLPADGHTFGANDPQVFSVQATDPNSDAYHGRVTVTPSGGGQPVTFDLAVTASGQASAGSPSAKFGDGSYTWTAVACDPAGSNSCSGASPARSFTVSGVSQGNSAPAAPQVLDPLANSMFDANERQDFVLRTTDPNGDPYQGDIRFRNALTGEPMPQRVQTHPAASGTNSAGTLLGDPLPPGSYQMEATARDPHGATSPQTIQSFSVAAVTAAPCSAAGALVDGYFGDRYLQVSTTTVGGVAYVCLKTAQGLDSFAGWLRAETGGGEAGGGVPTVGTSAACPDSGEGLTPFPLLDQTVGPPAAQTQLWAALHKTGTTLTACFKVKLAGGNLLDHAVTIQAPAGTTLSKLDFVPQDTPGSWTPPAEVAPGVGLPSSECYAASGKTRYVNAKVDGQHVWLYSQQESGVRRLCARIEGASSRGVVVREHADNLGQPALWQVGLPVDHASSPCTPNWSLYESNSPYHARLWMAAPDGDPLAVCVSAGLSGPMLAGWLKLDRSPDGSVTSHALDS